MQAARLACCPAPTQTFLLAKGLRIPTLTPAANPFLSGTDCSLPVTSDYLGATRAVTDGEWNGDAFEIISGQGKGGRVPVKASSWHCARRVQFRPSTKIFWLRMLLF